MLCLRIVLNTYVQTKLKYFKLQVFDFGNRIEHIPQHAGAETNVSENGFACANSDRKMKTRKYSEKNRPSFLTGPRPLSLKGESRLEKGAWLCPKEKQCQVLT